MSCLSVSCLSVSGRVTVIITVDFHSTTAEKLDHSRNLKMKEKVLVLDKFKNYGFRYIDGRTDGWIDRRVNDIICAPT